MMLLLLALITLYGAVLRVDLLRAPLTYDEIYNYVWFAHGGFLNIISNYHVPNNHILNTLLSWLSTSAFGFSRPAFRFPALVAGVLCIPATYAAGKRLHSPVVGILGALLIAVNAAFIVYSVQSRGYALQALLVLLMVYVALDLRARGRSFSAWRWYILLSVAALWVMPSSISAVAGIGAWLLITSRWKRQVIFAHVYVGLFAALLYLPVVKSTGLDALVANRFVVPLAPDAFWAAVGIAINEHGWTFSGQFAPLIVMLLAFGVLVALAGLAWEHAPTSWLTPVMVSIALACILIQRNPGYGRTWLYLLPFLVLFGLSGLTMVTRAMWLTSLSRKTNWFHPSRRVIRE